MVAFKFSRKLWNSLNSSGLALAGVSTFFSKGFGSEGLSFWSRPSIFELISLISVNLS